MAQTSEAQYGNPITAGFLYNAMQSKKKKCARTPEGYVPPRTSVKRKLEYDDVNNNSDAGGNRSNDNRNDSRGNDSRSNNNGINNNVNNISFSPVILNSDVMSYILKDIESLFKNLTNVSDEQLTTILGIIMGRVSKLLLNKTTASPEQQDTKSPKKDISQKSPQTNPQKNLFNDI